MQKVHENLTVSRIKIFESVDFIVKKFLCLDSVVERVGEFVGKNFVVFEQPVIRFFGEQQRRKIQRVNKNRPLPSPKKIGIVMADIMSTYKLITFCKILKISLWRSMQSFPICRHRPIIQNLVVLGIDFEVDEDYGGHSGGIKQVKQ